MPTWRPLAADNDLAGRASEALAYADAILDGFQSPLGRDHIAYRNHVARVIHLCLMLCRTADPDVNAKVAIAAAFHDLGIWTHGTLDYLGPSIGLAGDYLDRVGRRRWRTEIAAMIDLHHKVRLAPVGTGPLAEAFRRADWIDVSLGVLRFGLPGHRIRKIRRRFPNAGFHRRLAELTRDRLHTHPLDPLPMFKW